MSQHMEQDRWTEILQHLRAAAELAEQEAKEQQAPHPMAEAFRKAAHITDYVPASQQQVSSAFNTLTASLLVAGMQISAANEIYVRMSNALNEALHAVLHEKGSGQS